MSEKAVEYLSKQIENINNKLKEISDDIHCVDIEINTINDKIILILNLPSNICYYFKFNMMSLFLNTQHYYRLDNAMFTLSYASFSDSSICSRDGLSITL